MLSDDTLYGQLLQYAREALPTHLRWGRFQATLLLSDLEKSQAE